MCSLATEFIQRRSPSANVLSPEMQHRSLSLKLRHLSPEDGGRLVSWESLSTHHEASYVLRLLSVAARIALESEYITLSSNCDRSMDISIIQAYCALIQSWRIFYGTPCYVQGIPLPLQLSLPLLYKYPPTSRYLNRDETQSLLLSCREEKRLRLSCFARSGS